MKSEIRVSGRSVVFEDLFDLEEIQVIQDQFARATGVASIITRPDGTPITKPSNFCRLCNDIIRNTEKGRANCFKSDASLGRSNPSGPIMQPCLSGGLWDGGAGISVEGVHIANWLIGQVRNETQSDERMLLYAEEIGADEDEFARALAEVKVMPTAQFKEICNALFLFANQLSQTAYQNLRQEQIIEERRVVERALADAKGYIDSIINSMPSVLIGIDAAFRITHWNNQAEKFENILAGEALGRKLHEVLPRFVDFVPHVQRAVKEHTIQSFSNVTRRIEARVIYEDIAVYPLLSETAEGAVIRIDDVTARFEMEQQLAQSRKMDAVGRLAGGIAHDFNNMLGGIIGAAEVLMDTVPSEGRKLLDVIVRSAERAADLTANLLSFSRKGKVSARSVDVHAVIRNTASLLERSLDKRIAIRLNLDAPLSTVIGDESQLHSALLNIGINAGQAMADGGELSFSSKIVYLDEAYCAASQFDLAPGSYLNIDIRDTGIGIPMEILPRIFEPFFTTKEQGKGTGLGLAAVWGMLQDHKGAVTVYSEPNVGTVFHAYLPISDRTAAGLEEPSFEPVTGTGRILVVDDEEAVRITAERILTALEYEVITASDGLEAAEIFKKRHADIDLVLLDMIMPKMNGTETFEVMKRIDPAVRIVISSGFSKEEDLMELKNRGLIACIRKPYRKAELGRVVAEALAVFKEAPEGPLS